ncbi:MAG: hypothetical protein NT166_29390 [Candidatus Aminicenantes bacterium]|nr:hypothetical protein [Candidatus Aminicenantes bacterium]
MTQKERVAAIMADPGISPAQKVMIFIISSSTDQLGALTAKKLAKLFETPVDTLNSIFLKEQKKSIDQYILFYKMHTAYCLMNKSKGKRPKLSVLSKRLGFKKYAAFAYRFKKYIPITPRQIIRISREWNN